MENKMLKNLDYEARLVIEEISSIYDIDINILIQVFMLGSMKAIEALETIASAKLLKESFEKDEDFESFDKKNDKNRFN